MWEKSNIGFMQIETIYHFWREENGRFQKIILSDSIYQIFVLFLIWSFWQTSWKKKITFGLILQKLSLQPICGEKIRKNHFYIFSSKACDWTKTLFLQLNFTLAQVNRKNKGEINLKPLLSFFLSLIDLFFCLDAFQAQNRLQSRINSFVHTDLES